MLQLLWVTWMTRFAILSIGRLVDEGSTGNIGRVGRFTSLGMWEVLRVMEVFEDGM